MSTPIYALTEWGAAQETPWVPHNAALRALEAVSRGSVLDRDMSAPPGTCADGACYLIAAGATGAWTTHDGKMAVAVGEDAGSGWIVLTVATEGQFLYVEDEAVRIQYIGAVWVAANLSPIWGDIGGSIADQSDLTAAIAAAGGNTGGSQQLTGIVSGLGVINTANLDFAMSAGSFYLDSELVSAAAQTISLDAADATHPRIDVLYVDNTGTLGKITGTPSATPSQPTVDPTTQLFLTFVLVPETATSLGGITNVDIYREGTEWTPTASGTGFTVNSTSTPYAGTKCIEGTAVAAGAYAKMVAGAPIAFDGDGNLTLRIRSKATWNAKRWLTLQWYLGGVAVGSQVSLKSGSFGFVSSDTSGYQLAVINKSLFQVPAGASVDELRIADVGGSIGFFIDDVILQTTGETTGGGGQASGITQTDADARYARRANNLSDLTDTAAARTNLDVYSKAQVDAAIGGGGGGGGTAATAAEQLDGTLDTVFATPDSVAALWEKGSDIASAATISVGEGGLFHVTGTTAITDIDPATDKAGRRFTLVFDGALTLTHNASTLILPGGANITTAAGDSATFVSEGSDAVRCVGYQRASGAALVGGGGGSLPAGGSTGQVLTKASATDGDATWQTVSNGRITPTLIQKVTQRAGGTFSLPAAPTAGNLLVWLTAGFNSAWSLAGFYVVGYFTTTNQVVACYARKVVAGDANSFTVGASSDKAGVLYEFQDASGVFPLTGGAMSGFFSSANFTLPLPPSLFATSDTRLLALESDTAAVWSVTPETGYSEDYVVPSGAAGNHYSVIGRLSDLFDGTLAGSTSASPINPVFGLFEVVGR